MSDVFKGLEKSICQQQQMTYIDAVIKSLM